MTLREVADSVADALEWALAHDRALIVEEMQVYAKLLREAKDENEDW